MIELAKMLIILPFVQESWANPETALAFTYPTPYCHTLVDTHRLTGS